MMADKFWSEWGPSIAGAGAIGLAGAYPIADLIWDKPNWKQRLLAALVGVTTGGVGTKMVTDAIKHKDKSVGQHVSQFSSGLTDAITQKGKIPNSSMSYKGGYWLGAPVQNTMDLATMPVTLGIKAANDIVVGHNMKSTADLPGNIQLTRKSYPGSTSINPATKPELDAGATANLALKQPGLVSRYDKGSGLYSSKLGYSIPMMLGLNLLGGSQAPALAFAGAQGVQNLAAAAYRSKGLSNHQLLRKGIGTISGDTFGLGQKFRTGTAGGLGLLTALFSALMSDKVQKQPDL